MREAAFLSYRIWLLLSGYIGLEGDQGDEDEQQHRTDDVEEADAIQ